MGEIRKDNLHESLIEELNELANIDLSGKQDKTDESLLTESKDLVGAINELFQSANNGKELIANAIGEPLSSEDTFSAMSNDINGLLSTFKTNMMNNGITVDSGDRFKSLIDKIATMVEEGSGKGIHYASGEIESITVPGMTYETMYTYTKIPLNINIDFIPNVLLLEIPALGYYSNGSFDCNCIIDCIRYNSSDNVTSIPNHGNNPLSAYFVLDEMAIYIWNTAYVEVSFNNIKWYAIGVGEEDTTLRDSLASILEEEGVSVTEEDDMASLISKVDEEFTNDNNTISDLNTDIENTRNTLAGLMQEGGYDITGEEDIDSLLELLVLSGISVSEIKQVACGANHTFILKNDGSVWSCGSNSNGELGLNTTTNIYKSFIQVTTNINNDVKQVVCGENHTIILKNDGSVWSCGYNGSGQLGVGNTTTYKAFTQVTTNINNDVKQIYCGSNYTFILKNDGSVWACGINGWGQLGLGDTANKYTFTQVTTNINNDVAQIACGESHTFILKNDASIWSCGRNGNGQLGLGSSDTNIHSTFTQVTTNVNNDVKQIACGDSFTFILKNDGSVLSCGYNYYGQLGLNDTTNQTSFTQVTTNVNNDVNQIACGWYHTFILKNDGTVWSCGYNYYGQLGLGDTTNQSTFTQVTTNINNDVKQVYCGFYQTFILKKDGSVWCCGNNESGQLGLDDTTNRTTFTDIPKGFSY